LVAAFSGSWWWSGPAPDGAVGVALAGRGRQSSLAVRAVPPRRWCRRAGQRDFLPADE